MPQFKIEQLALCPTDPEAAIALLSKMGMEEWAKDHVVARGNVGADRDQKNEADLAFHYPPGRKLEVEVLHYTDGNNWMANQSARCSHLGMHCTAEELAEWRAFFKAEGIAEAQAVLTESHTNEVIAGKRWYHYVIFDTYEILGIDVKFIVRKSHAPVQP